MKLGIQRIKLCACTTTRTPVVFNASAKSDNCKGLSLNDCLMIGPVLQSELFDVLIRFQTYAVAFTCNIKQMYRQILINESHRDCQWILWRNDVNEPIHTG